jgi:hypothetical protein
VLVKKLLIAGCVLALAGLGLLIPVGGTSAPEGSTRSPDAKTMSLTELSTARPQAPLRLLFIHHSVGGRWLAEAGPKEATGNEIWKSHPEGGGLRKALEAQGYQVTEASYGSPLGEHTDDGDWLPKFRDQMDAVLDGKQNKIVMFKSCFPNNLLDDEAALEKAKASYRALLPIFAQHPDVLFVRVTTPPLAPRTEKEPAWKMVARTVLGKPQPAPRLKRSGPLARKLEEWAVSPDGWLRDYPQKNLAVFDLYGVLTDGKSDYLAFPTGDGMDSHPSRAGNERATSELVPFLNRAVRRAGLSP